MNRLFSMLAGSVALVTLALWTTSQGGAQESEGPQVSCGYEMPPGGERLIFRYRVDSADFRCGEVGDPDDENPDPEDEDEDENGDDEDEQGDGEIPPGGADFYSDSSMSYINQGDAPSPFRLALTEKRTVPNEDGLTWQCVSATGGHGNYLWVMDTGPGSGDFGWLSDWDIVTKADLDAPMPSPVYNGSFTAPWHDPDNSRFALNLGGEVCVRVRSNPDVSATNYAYIDLSLEDMSPWQVDGGYMDDSQYWGASSYGYTTVVICQDNCDMAPPTYGIFGESPFELVLGNEEWIPWYASYGTAPYTYEFEVPDDSLLEFTFDETYDDYTVRGDALGLFPVTVKATDDSGVVVEREVEIHVVAAPSLVIGGDVEPFVVGQHNWPWWAEGGSGEYTWELDAATPHLRQSESWGDPILVAHEPGTYENVEVRVIDEADQVAIWTGTITVTAGESGTFAWGSNSIAQHGSSWGTWSPADGKPYEVYHTHKWDTISAGRTGCAISLDGELYCWGRLTNGYLGLGTGVQQDHQDQAVEPSGGWTHVSAGNFGSVCALRNGGQLWCWGDNSRRQLGTGVPDSSPVPTRIEPSTSGWTDVSVGNSNACGIRNSDLFCWGSSSGSGLVGTGSANDVVAAPVQVGESGGWTSVSAGQTHSCGIRNGALWCWGSGSGGRLGTGSTANVFEPAEIMPGTTGWQSVSAGGDGTCGIRSGSLWCWGSNQYGVVGNGDYGGAAVLEPLRISATGDWLSIDVDNGVACGIRGQGGEGGLFCWGRSSFNGHPTIAGNISTPTFIDMPRHVWTDVSVADGYALAQGYEGTWYPETTDRDEEFDPGRPCGTGGSGKPVCEDDSPSADDLVWDGGPEDYALPEDGGPDPWEHWAPSGFFGSIANVWYEYPDGNGQNFKNLKHGLKTTGWSTQSMVNGLPFSYYCFRVYNGWHTNWDFYLAMGIRGNWNYPSHPPAWIKRLDLVPRAQLFSGYPPVYSEETWNWQVYKWPRHSGTSTEKEMCARWVAGPLEPESDGEYLTIFPLSISTRNGDPGYENPWDYTALLWTMYISPAP